jgi:voltage-gated potassium channel
MSKWPIQKRNDDALKRYDDASVYFWLPISLAYVTITLMQVFGSLKESPRIEQFDIAMSVLFLVDYLLRIYMAEDRLAFARHYWNIADAIVIATPLIMWRFGSDWSGLLRLARVYRLGVIARRAWTARTRGSQLSEVKFFALFASGVAVIAWLLVWSAETAHTGSPIHTIWDAGWWAIVTTLTVGYGETYPHTGRGKVFAIILMIVGVALFGWITAALASRFVESGKEKKADEQRDRMDGLLQQMAQQLADVQRQVANLAHTLSERGELRGFSPLVASKPTAVVPADAKSVSQEEVKDERWWRDTKLWRQASRQRQRAKGFLRRVFARDASWYWVSVALYLVALAESHWSTHTHVAAAVLAGVLFVYALCLRLPRRVAGWVQWAAWLSAAIYLASDLPGPPWSPAALLFAGVVAGAIELRGSLGVPAWPNSPLPQE